jgi:Leucine-rich repeat (LRR) protein
MGKMPPGLNGLTNLKNLEMEWCGIREFDPAVLSLGNLDYLNLEGNEISTLPAKGWKGMRTLRNLQLQQNKLSALPKDINQLGALTYIDLSSNQLKALPKGFSKLGSLQSMYLAGNKDIKIPKEIKKMHLEVIYLKTGDLNAKALANLKKWVGAEVVQVTDY